MNASHIAGTNQTITVSYLIYKPRDALCCPSGGKQTVRYHWNGSRLVPFDPIPPRQTDTQPGR